LLLCKFGWTGAASGAAYVCIISVLTMVTYHPLTFPFFLLLIGCIVGVPVGAFVGILAAAVAMLVERVGALVSRSGALRRGTFTFGAALGAGGGVCAFWFLFYQAPPGWWLIAGSAVVAGVTGVLSAPTAQARCRRGLEVRVHVEE
jgi:hypothetical protein